MPGGTPVAAYEATLEGRILLSAVSTAVDGRDDSAKDGAATGSDSQPDSQPASQSDSTQDSFSQDGPEKTSDFFPVDSFPVSGGGLFQEIVTESETANRSVAAGSVGESESSGQQASGSTSGNSNVSFLNSSPGDSVVGMASLPASIESIGDSKLNSNLVSDPGSNSNTDANSKDHSEEFQHDPSDSPGQLDDDLAVLAEGAQFGNWLPSDSPTSQNLAGDASLAEEWQDGLSRLPAGSSAGQRRASFGRAYAIVPKQRERALAVGEAANASGGDSVRSKSAQPVERVQVWRPVSALLSGIERAESDLGSSAVVRVTNWMTGQTRNRHRLTLAESTVTLATEREFAAAGEGGSQGLSHDSQNHVLIRLETEVAGVATDVEADDNPPERPDVLGVWQHLKFDCNPRGPPVDDRIPISGFTRRTGSGDQLHQLRFSIAPRGPSVGFRS